MPLKVPATTQPGLYHEAFLQYSVTPGVVQTVVFDAVTSEDWDEPSSVTEHPVENGANVTDHVRVGLAKCTLKVRVTNEPLDSNQFVDPVGGAGQMVGFPIGIPMPKTVGFDGVVIVPTWQNNLDEAVLIGSIAGTASDAAAHFTDAALAGTPVGNAIAEELVKTARVTNDINQLWAYREDAPQIAIGGFPVRSASDVVGALVFEGITSLIPAGEEIDLPVQTDAGLPAGDGFSVGVVAQTVQFAGSRDFCADMKALLVGLKNSAQLFTVQGSKQIQANMVIETLTSHRGAPDETGTGMEITIGLKQVRIVSTNTVPVPVPALPRATTPTNLGAQDPTPATPAQTASVLHKALGGAINLLSRGAPPGVP